MSFITTTELKNGMYAHIVANITQEDNTIAQHAIEAAEAEVRSYLATRYDTNAIFAATGDNRDALVTEQITIVAIWNLIKISSVETLYNEWRERYDRVTNYLRDVVSGTIAPSLPLRKDAQGNVSIRIKSGSNPKFTHSI